MAGAIGVEVDEPGREADNHRLPIPKYPAVARQSVTYTTSVATTNAFNGKTRFIAFIADAKAHFAIAAAPTAAATSEWIPADTWHEVGVEPGSALKIAFYDGSS